MSSSKKSRAFFLIILLATFVVSAVSCNSKTEDDENEIAVTPAIVAVKNFKLQANDTILNHLDSVFFSIDLTTGVIFNADSLPKGTDVRRLIPVITFANTMSKAELTFLKDNSTDTTTNYLTNPTDSIDFTHPVKLNVTAQDGLNSFTYTIKVNVHKQVPDTIVWDRLATSTLPSRLPDPLMQRTVYRDGTAYCLIEENDYTYTLSICTDLNKGEWIKMEFDPEMFPNVATFTVTPSCFYLLNANDQLCYSADLESWTNTGLTWVSIIGGYSDTILGIRNDGSKFVHSQYPEYPGFEETELEEGFPLFNSSELGQISSKWAEYPIAILMGGLTQAGEPTSAVWAYDGTTWTIINENYLPALEAPMMVRYVVFRDTPAAFTQRRFDVWLLFGGVSADQEMNRKVYFSYDNGVNWILAPEEMQLPEELPSLADADIIVAQYDLSADLSEAWTLVNSKSAATRAEYEINGVDITWKCPYLYIFGGYLPDNTLSTEIWRGVLQRLTFTPQI